MDYEAWQVKRRELMEKEKGERNANWQQSRPPLQASINEQAIRELYGKIAALEAAVTEPSRTQKSAVKG
jgi:hypothetical protein